jgi:hypothetical protein
VKSSTRVLLSLLLCGLFAPAVVGAPQNTGKFEHVVFVGASVSAGFGGGLAPSTPFEKAILSAHRPVERFASPLFYMGAAAEGTRQIDRAIATKPTLVIGLDYLIWFLYGSVSPAPRTGPDNRVESDAVVDIRMRQLEAGLSLLERLDVPIAVGDIPDMFGADPAMLSPQQIPSPKVIEGANRRIREWAKPRQNVLLLPLASWVADMRNGKLSLALSQGRALTPPPDKVLMPDRVHPSKLGTVMLCARLVESLQEWTGVSRKDFNFDAEQALRDAGEMF